YGLTSGRGTGARLGAHILRPWAKPNSAHRDVSAPPQPGRGPDQNERGVRAAGIAEGAHYPLVAAHDWTIDTIVGNLYSTSFCSKQVLGANAAAFEAELKAALLTQDASGKYHEQMRFGYTIGRKPGVPAVTEQKTTPHVQSGYGSP